MVRTIKYHFQMSVIFENMVNLQQMVIQKLTLNDVLTHFNNFLPNTNKISIN